MRRDDSGGAGMAGAFKDAGSGSGVEMWLLPFLTAGVLCLFAALLTAGTGETEAGGGGVRLAGRPTLAILRDNEDRRPPAVADLRW